MEKQEFRFTGRTINHIKKLKHREHIGKIRLDGYQRSEHAISVDTSHVFLKQFINVLYINTKFNKVFIIE